MQKKCTNAEELSTSLHCGRKCTLLGLIEKKIIMHGQIDHFYSNSMKVFIIFCLSQRSPCILKYYF